MTSAMLRAYRRLPAGLALALALSALALPSGASAAATATTPGRSTPSAPPKFPIPASARVHGSSPTTTPTGAAPNIATTPATTPAGAAPATVTTTPAGAASSPTTTTTPAATAPVSTTPVATTGAPASTTPVLPTGSAATHAPGTQHTTTTKLSTGAIIAAVLAVLLILVCLAWGAARWFAYEPRWSISLRHSLAEASWRLSASWDEFSDWARIGR